MLKRFSDWLFWLRTGKPRIRAGERIDRGDMVYIEGRNAYKMPPKPERPIGVVIDDSRIRIDPSLFDDTDALDAVSYATVRLHDHQ